MSDESGMKVVLVNSRYSYGGEGSHWDGCVDVHWDCRIAWLEKRVAELEQNNQWISVKDRLPPKGRWVLLLATDYSHPVVGIRGGGEMDIQYEEEYAYNLLDVITHWMPLPEMPKEEK